MLTSTRVDTTFDSIIPTRWLKGTFNPLTLFSGGTTGAWYDPSDLSTMFQDSAGTTAVTGANQPVGLIRDKSGNGNHLIQTSASSRPTLRVSGSTYYLEFDGVDDFLTISSFSLSSDKVTIFVGMRKLYDAASRFVIELSSDASANNGAFAISSPTGAGNNNIRFRSTGTLSTFATVTTPTVPTNLVVTSVGDISGDLSKITINRTTTNSSTSDQGTGNYQTYPMWVARRDALTTRLNAYIYEILIVGKLSSDTAIAATEYWIANKMGITL